MNQARSPDADSRIMVTPWLPSLAEPYLKTTRAKVHLEDLKGKLRAFLHSKPYTVTAEDDFDAGRYVVIIKPNVVPDEVALIAGDFFYCLRCALDQAVFFLAKLNLADPVHTQFPIQDSFSKDGRLRFARQTAGVPAEAVRIIEELQPYNRGDRASARACLLWELNALCNTDKHRRIPVHSQISDFYFPDLPQTAKKDLTVNFRQDHAVCASVPLALKGKMTLDPDFAMDIFFGDMAVGVKCGVDRVGTMYEFVADSVLPRFARFFQ